jgi:hypothetical protein
LNINNSDMSKLKFVAIGGLALGAISSIIAAYIPLYLEPQALDQ